MKATCKECGVDEPDHREACSVDLRQRLELRTLERDRAEARVRELETTAMAYAHERDAAFAKMVRLAEECFLLQQWDERRVHEARIRELEALNRNAILRAEKAEDEGKLWRNRAELAEAQARALEVECARHEARERV